MEDCTTHNESKKRARDDSETCTFSPEPKRLQVDSGGKSSELDRVDSALAELNQVDSALTELNQVDSALTELNQEDSSSAKLNLIDTEHDIIDRVDSVNDIIDRVDSDVPEMKSSDTIHITDDILHILEDPDIDSSIQGLDSVIKSFEEEIADPFPTLDSGELDYLLGASDDELGLPPAKSPHVENSEYKSTESIDQVVEIREDFAFVDELPSYDPCELGIGEENNEKSEYVVLGGLFDYSEMSEYSWQPVIDGLITMKNVYSFCRLTGSIEM